MARKRPLFRKKKTSARGRRGGRGKIFLWLILLLAATVSYFLYGMPSLDAVKPIDIKPSIAVLANDGTLIARYGGMHGEKINARELPPHMLAAVVAIEDRRFYKHFGIDPIGLGRAMGANLLARGWVQGGSTITQQLAKNLFLTPDKTLRRKVQEAIMALRIEQRYGKNDILTAYLNRVYFGAGAYGIDAAARTYFGKDARTLDLWESAMLAGLLKAPSRFSPSANPERAKQRAETVIEAMKNAGYIDAKTRLREIKNVKIYRANALAGDINRYFADWVIDQIDRFVEVSDGDVVVKTTLDPRFQAQAADAQSAMFKRITPADKVSQAALVTLATDGAVLAMTGGVDYRASQFNRATQAQRQAGSAFKPFVYLAALEAGFTPESEIEDAPITEGSYRPENYDGKYFGTVPLSYALAKSMNTATIRLLQQVGVDRMIDVARRAGLDGELRPELATGLGTGQFSLLDLTSAYAAFANGGYVTHPYAVLSVTGRDGSILYERPEVDPLRTFDGATIAGLDSMLRRVPVDGTGAGAALPGVSVAGKTGTTQNYRDAWFIGYAGRLVTGVWMGNDDETPMQKVTGGKFPAQLWRDCMRGAVTLNVPDFARAPGQGLFSDMLNRWSAPAEETAAPDDAPDYNR